MKIVVITRTRNEERNIARFCVTHRWADEILVADAGSLDSTVEIARQFPYVSVRQFLKKFHFNSGLWKSDPGPHMNFLVKWAKSRDADWIVYSDCDEFPNIHLQEDIWCWLKRFYSNRDCVYVTKLYVYKHNRYFPDMSQDEDGWLTNIWAWKPTADVEFVTSERFNQELILGDKQEIGYLTPPSYCILHNPWPNEKEIKRKMEFYNKTSFTDVKVPHPKESYGKLKSLPDWATDIEEISNED